MFNDQSGAAMEFYASVIPDCRVASKIPGPDGSVAGGTFEIESQRFLCYNGGTHPKFALTQGISLMIEANTQEEIDFLFNGF